MATKAKPKTTTDDQLVITTVFLTARTLRFLGAVTAGTNNTVSTLTEEILSEALEPFAEDYDDD